MLLPFLSAHAGAPSNDRRANATVIGAADHVGGNLVFNLDLVPPVPEIETSLDLIGGLDPATGQATLYGSVWCSGPGPLQIWGTVVQEKSGQPVASDGFWINTECDGAAQWSATIHDGPDGLDNG